MDSGGEKLVEAMSCFSLAVKSWEAEEEDSTPHCGLVSIDILLDFLGLHSWSSSSSDLVGPIWYYHHRHCPYSSFGLLEFEFSCYV